MRAVDMVLAFCWILLRLFRYDARYPVGIDDDYILQLRVYIASAVLSIYHE